MDFQTKIFFAHRLLSARRAGWIACLFSLFACHDVTAANYKGVGGQIEAYGTVVLAFLHPQQLIAVCGKRYPGLKNDVETGEHLFLSKNKPIYDQITARMKVHAYSYGGAKEMERLSKEITDSLPLMINNLRPATQEMTETENSCRAIIRLILAGDMDLKIRNQKWINLILYDKK